MNAISQATRDIVIERGWEPGTELENRVALHLSRLGCKPEAWAQQHRVGRYRLDFAAPDFKLDLEADGRHHFNPEGALRDALRDSWLRNQGWTVIRVDDRSSDGALRDQLVNVLRYLASMVDTHQGKPWWSKHAKTKKQHVEAER